MRFFKKYDEDPSPKLVSMAIIRDEENFVYNSLSVSDLRRPRTYSLCSDITYTQQNDPIDDRLPSLELTDDEDDWTETGSYTRSLDFDRSSLNSEKTSGYYRSNPGTVSSLSSFMSGNRKLQGSGGRYRKACCYTAVPAMVVEDPPHYGSTTSLHLTMKRGFSTWGKKMGRKLEQLTRGDSKENVSFPLGSTRSRKRYWKPNKKTESFTESRENLETDRPTRKSKIDRVESIRNLFKRSRSWDSSKDLDDDLSHHDMPSLSATISSDELTSKLDDEISNLADKIDQINNAQRSPLLRSVSASHLHIEESSLSNAPLYTTEVPESANKDVPDTVKKAQFPYAFLRSKLTSVSEEMSLHRDECGDSGRGTESNCGSVRDVRASFSENSDKSSYSDSLDGKPIKEETEETSIPAPTSFADSQYSVKVQVEGLTSKKPKVSQIPTSTKTRKLHKKPTEKKTEAHTITESTDRKKSRDSLQRSRIKSRASRSEIIPSPGALGSLSPTTESRSNKVGIVNSRHVRSSSLERSMLNTRNWNDDNDARPGGQVTLRRAPSLPKPQGVASLTSLSLSQKKFRLVRLVKEKSESLGLFISGHKGEGYVISHIVLGGPTYRDGRLREGDEIVNLNGSALRTLEVHEAQSLLRTSGTEVDIVVARDPDSSLDDESIPSRLSSRHESDAEEESQDWYYRCKSEGSNFSGRFNCSRSQSLEPSSLHLSSDNLCSPSSKLKSPTHIVKHSSMLFKDKELEYPSRSWSSNWKDAAKRSNSTESFIEYSDRPARRILPGIGRYEKGDQSSSPQRSSHTSSSKRSSRELSSSRLARPTCTSTLPRRPKSLNLSFHVVLFEKGPGYKPLGFSVVGGQGSIKGDIGIYVKQICSDGQAEEQGSLRVGDEILSINGESMTGMTHSQAISAFRKIKFGKVLLYVSRRTRSNKECHKAKSFDALDKCDS